MLVMYRILVTYFAFLLEILINRHEMTVYIVIEIIKNVLRQKNTSIIQYGSV